MSVRRVAKLAVLLLTAMLGVHVLRSVLMFGGDAEQAFGPHGHGYLRPAIVAAVICGALVLAAALVRAAGAADRRGRWYVVARRLWPAATAALLVLYGGQELLQGWLSVGHPAGLDSLVTGGGWVAGPLALGFGLLIALSMRVARALSDECRARVRAPRPRALGAPLPVLLVVHRRSRRDRLLVRLLAGRAPPQVCG